MILHTKKAASKFENPFFEHYVEIVKGQSYFTIFIEEETRKMYFFIILTDNQTIYIRDTVNGIWEQVDNSEDFRAIWSLFENAKKDVNFVWRSRRSTEDSMAMFKSFLGMPRFK